MLVELLVAGLLFGSIGNNNRKNAQPRRKKKSSVWEFEEVDTFTDKHGNEHAVDYEGYCDECDDYHND